MLFCIHFCYHFLDSVTPAFHQAEVSRECLKSKGSPPLIDVCDAVPGPHSSELQPTISTYDQKIHSSDLSHSSEYEKVVGSKLLVENRR